MKQKNLFLLMTAFSASLFSLIACNKHNNLNDGFDVSGTYTQVDQMGRPAINTVFVNKPRKDEFNTTIPSAMNAAFNAQFQSVLTSFGYTTNILGLDKATFATVLANDVLNVKLNGKTTFYDGTNVLTGRALSDDVIDTELTLIFGGADGSSNPGLTSDHVNANDKPFSSTFPYLASPW
jgi:hypothetical protein